MKKSDITFRLREGFSELSPDIFEQIITVTDQTKPILPEMENEKKEKYLEHEEWVGSEKRWNFWKKCAISVCASLAVFCICLFGFLGENKDDIYLILDINPSIQIVMDDSFQVKRLQGLNQDGRDVIKKLQWDKKESLFNTLNSVLEAVVEDAYLKADSGILITICLSDPDMYEELEEKIGENIDRKLGEMRLFGITAAFQQGEKDSVEEGRKQLEAEIAENYGMDEEQVKQMSVMELISYVHEQGFSGVTLSPESARQREEFYQQKKEKSKDKIENGKDKKVNSKDKESNRKDGIDDSKDMNSNDKNSDNKDKNENNKNKNENNKDKNKNSKDNKDKDKNDNSKDKNSNNKDKNKNDNSKDKNNNNKDKNKNKDENSKDNKDKAKDSSKKNNKKSNSNAPNKK